MRDVIDLTYVKDQRIYYGDISRCEFQETLSDLIRSYPNCNVNAIKLSELLPKIKQITVNQDIIDTKDVPFFEYTLVNASHPDTLSLSRPCRIVWNEIHKYCDEATR